MSEINVILRSILLGAKKAKSVSEIIDNIEVLCSKEDIDVVEATYRKWQEKYNTADNK